MTNPVYRSEVDQRLLTVARMATVAALGSVAATFYFGFSASSLVAIPLLLAGAALPWWILNTTDYTLTNRSLEIRCGPFHWSVQLDSITRIQRTRSSVSSPALSLDRLRIQHRAGAQVMISPEKRQDFLAELRRRGVQVEIDR
jgi:hypothetical protein